MHRNVTTVAGSTSLDQELSNAKPPKVTIVSRCTELFTTKYWQPHALRAPVLVFTIAVCWSLIALLEFLLWKSQRDSGLIFAPVINDLPLSDTFLYLYFPTIVAVIFSIYWAWIDLDTKRMEPYYQLSKENGALGKDSLLLEYPFSFIPLAPLRAFRDRHWPVFWASLAVVIVTWGLVPTQAGIFNVRTITRTTNTTFAVSTSSMPFDKQATGLTYRFAESTYGIVSLNETLPPYMARNYTLAPFKPRENQSNLVGQGTYTAPTTMYTLDLYCEDASHKADNSSNRPTYTSNGGCKFNDTGLTGNDTVGDGSKSFENSAIKRYNAMYIGFHNAGLADFYLSPNCPKSENTTFFAAFSKSKERPEDPPRDVTAVFCKPRYWRQDVSATVDRLTKAPLAVTALADREPLEWNVFNTTNLEMIMNSGSTVKVRGDALPEMSLPTYRDEVARLNLTLAPSQMPMVGLAIGANTRPLEEYLDWQMLSKAYSEAYRLLFVRAMVDVLNNGTEFLEEVPGQQHVISEAVVLEPVFVHIVVGFLGIVSIATIALLVLTFIRRRNLRTDPSTIASIMAMVADDEPLLSDFADLDCCTLEDVQLVLAQKRYRLSNDESGTSLSEITHGNTADPEAGAINSLGPRRDSPSSIAKPVRPTEFSLWVALPFVSLFVLLAIVLGIVFEKAHANGLPLPSSNTIVRNILENYIPTAIATLIEPMWVLINRLLCMLQPIEELQSCNAKANKSIDTDYSSLPPQLVIFQALRSKHFVLAAVCAMALLANLLAVAFSGLFNQGLTTVRYQTTFQSPFEFKFVPINGSIGPTTAFNYASGAYRGGDGKDQFLIAESNYTRNTPLPPWTDDSMFYMPLFAEGNNNTQINTTNLEANTQAFGATLDCEQLTFGQGFEARLENSAFSMNVSVAGTSGKVQCTNDLFRNSVSPCMDETSSKEFVYLLEPRENATIQEKNACMSSVVLGWMRVSQGVCSKPGSVRMRTDNTLFVLCRPRLVAGSATIRVDESGRLQSPARQLSLENSTTDDSSNRYSTDPINLIGHSNSYLFRVGGGYHNDSFANDYFNHFLGRDGNTTRSRIVDPSQPVPKFDDVLGPLQRVYSKLFAIWLARNKQALFLPMTDAALAPIVGARLELEQRLFLSTTMFIIAEVILCIYVIVAIWVYARRPGQYLARMPTSIASVIALFAASMAVQDMRGTSHLDKRGRAQHLERVDSRYGFGSFVGSDGRVHVGIEKVPLVVKPRAKSAWLEQKMPLLRKRTGGRG